MPPQKLGGHSSKPAAVNTHGFLNQLHSVPKALLHWYPTVFATLVSLNFHGNLNITFTTSHSGLPRNTLRVQPYHTVPDLSCLLCPPICYVIHNFKTSTGKFWSQFEMKSQLLDSQLLTASLYRHPTLSYFPMMSPRFLLNDPNLSDSYRFYVIHMMFPII